MRKYLPYIGLFFSMLTVFLLFGFARFKNKQHKISEVAIHFTNPNIKFLSSEMVDKLLIQKNGNPLNQLNSTINLHQIEKSVQNNEWVATADAFLKPKGILQIDISQRTPIARIQTREGYFYMDEQGESMPLSRRYSERVLLVDGNVSEERQKEVLEIVQFIRQSPFYKKQIIGISCLTNGEYKLSTRVGKHKILFGKADDISEKFKKLEVFYTKMWQNENLLKYNLLNIKYKNQVVCAY